MASARRVYIGLGSNLGDRQVNITEAVQQLRAGVRSLRVAELWDTEPVGYAEQPRFLNTVVAGETDLGPRDLLALLKAIEHRMGRQSAFRNAPRPIDLDILLLDECVLEEPGLEIPHPRLHQRAFVLEPLAQLAPDLLHPVLGRTVAELLREVDRAGVRPARRGLTMRLARDVQGEPPSVRVHLGRVGIERVRKTIHLAQGGRKHALQAEVSLLADIGASQKGLHMSRLSHALDDALSDAVSEEAPDVESLAARIATRVVETQGASRSEVRISAPFPLSRYTPVSGLPTEELYGLLGIAVCGVRGTRRMVGVEVVGMTACPCAQDMILQHTREELEDEGFSGEQVDRILERVPPAAHNQRAHAILMIGTQGRVRAQDLVEIAESSMSAENYGLLKRPDEFFVVHKAHRRPRFVEDVAREMLGGVVGAYADLSGEDYASARVVSDESIHKHDAYAEGGGTFAELRAQILDGEIIPSSTTAEQWLG